MLIPGIIKKKKVVQIASSAFKDCKCLKEVLIPEGVAVLYEESFSGRSNLTLFNLPTGITNICKLAFSECTHLEYVVLPKDAKVEAGAFNGCHDLNLSQVFQNVRVYKNKRQRGFINVPSPDSIIDGEKIRLAYQRIGFKGLMIQSVTRANGDLVLPDEYDDLPIIGIDQYAFQGRKELTSVKIQDGVKSIGLLVFNECPKLQTVVMDTGVSCVIKKGAFCGCESLTKIQLSKAVAEIESEAFASCTSLPFVEIPEGVAKLGDYAFQRRLRLKEIRLPSSLKRKNVGEGVFDQCPNLRYVELPSGNSDLKKLFEGHDVDFIEY